MKNKYILISGPKYSGKNYLANKLVDSLNNLGINTRLFAFAEPLKKWAKPIIKACGLDEEFHKESIRPLWINMARFIEKYNPLFFVENAYNETLNWYIFNNGICINTDTRFPIEIKFFKNKKNIKVITIRIEDPIFNYSKDPDISERALDDYKDKFDIVISNVKLRELYDNPSKFYDWINCLLHKLGVNYEEELL